MALGAAVTEAIGVGVSVGLVDVVGVGVTKGAAVNVALGKGVCVDSGDGVIDGVRVGSALALRVARLLTAVPVACTLGAVRGRFRRSQRPPNARTAHSASPRMIRHVQVRMARGPRLLLAP